jgi:hypothetical protein
MAGFEGVCFMADERQKALFPEFAPSPEEGRSGGVAVSEEQEEVLGKLLDAVRLPLGRLRRSQSSLRAMISGMATLAAGPWGTLRKPGRWPRELQRIRASASAGFLRDAINLHGDFSRAVSREMQHQTKQESNTPGDADGE